MSSGIREWGAFQKLGGKLTLHGPTMYKDVGIGVLNFCVWIALQDEGLLLPSARARCVDKRALHFPSMLLVQLQCLPLLTVLQKISVNGADQGQLKGIRAPNQNNVGTIFSAPLSSIG